MLLFLTSWSLAQSPSPWGALETPEDIDAATVLEHRVEITIDGSHRLRESHTWVLQVNAPERCVAGFPAPAGLDGAQHNGAQVFETLMVCPEETAAGTVFRLQKSRAVRRGPHSGEIQTVAGLPTLRADFIVRAPSYLPLDTWSDPHAHARYTRGRSMSAHLTWQDLDPDEQGHLFWSTWKSWDAVTDHLNSVIDPLMVSRETLGRDLAGSLKGSSLVEVARLASDAVTLVPGPADGWNGVRSPQQVLAEGTGSAVDRGIVLITLLRAAGYNARPALLRRGSEQGTPPAPLPAPGVMRHPLVEVRQQSGNILIDPAAPHVAAPSTPASFVNGVVWTAGNLPRTLSGVGLVDGTITLSTSGTLDRKGGLTWSTTVSMQGTAAEALRERLAPLTPEERTASLLGLARVSRPTLTRFSLTAQGVGSPARPLTLVIGGHDPDAATALGGGQEGIIRPTIGPALAAWLPPNILVRETMVVPAPRGRILITDAPPASVYRPDAMIMRDTWREANQAYFAWESLRPYRLTTPARDEAAIRVLHDGSRVGSRLFTLLPAASGGATALRSATDIDQNNATTLEALSWWSSGLERRARVTLRRHEKEYGIEGLITAMMRFASPGDPRPWNELVALADSPEDLLRIIDGYDAHGLRKEAWLLASHVAQTGPPDLQVQAMLQMERLQPEVRPSEGDEQQDAAVWQTPSALLDRAEASWASYAARPSETHPRILIRQAARLLDADAASKAEVLLEQALAQADLFELSEEERSMARVLRTHAVALSGLSLDEVHTRLAEDLAAHPFDAAVSREASDLLGTLGDAETALTFSLASAWLSPFDPAPWDRVATDALPLGELSVAHFAARRSSDLAPDDPERAETLRQLSLLMRDKEGVLMSAKRANRPMTESWPPSLEHLMALAPPEALLALLNHHEAEVKQDPSLLSLRAQLRAEAGKTERALYDAAYLSLAFDETEAHALVFAATVGKRWPLPMRDLDATVTHTPMSRAMRMEYRLIAGGDVLEDARALDGDPRAAVLLQTSTSPDALLDAAASWPRDLEDRRDRAPAGLRSNPLLGKMRGVQAWSDPVRSIAVLSVNSLTGQLPPPLGLLYELSDPPIRRGADGSLIVQLTGGPLPLYAAFGVHGEREIIGLGFTPGAASDALSLITAP